MLRFILLSIFLFLFVSCSQSVQQNSVAEPIAKPMMLSEDEEKVNATISPSEIEQKEEPIDASPVGNAVQTMQNAEKKMLDTLKLVGTLQGDQILDCEEYKAENFAKMKEFFGQHCFNFDRYVFWFNTNTGKKISVLETDGILKKCKIGYFTSYKRLISYQEYGNSVIETEFYMDSTKGELMVHRFRNGVRTANENYRLAGY